MSVTSRMDTIIVKLTTDYTFKLATPSLLLL